MPRDVTATMWATVMGWPYVAASCNEQVLSNPLGRHRACFCATACGSGLGAVLAWGILMRSGETTILVNDDDQLIRELVMIVLREAGCAVTAVATGEEAVWHAVSAPPHLLVLDYAMPVMSGRDVLRQLARMGTTFPVLVLSASLHAAECLSEGATCLVHKPFTHRGRIRVDRRPGHGISPVVLW